MATTTTQDSKPPTRSANPGSTCPDDCIGWSEDQLEMRLDWTYHSGRASAADDLADLLCKEAGKSFMKGDDSDATAKRDAADFIKGWAKNAWELQEIARNKYEEEYPEERD